MNQSTAMNITIEPVRMSLVPSDASVLHTPAQLARPEDADLVEELFATMRQEHGMGLAAPQVGIDRRLVVMQLSKSRIAMINPRILSRMPPVLKHFEKCLSIEEGGFVMRSPRLTVSWTDANQKRQKKQFMGLDACIVQHELDHLEGVLISDKFV